MAGARRAASEKGKGFCCDVNRSDINRYQSTCLQLLLRGLGARQPRQGIGHLLLGRGGLRVHGHDADLAHRGVAVLGLAPLLLVFAAAALSWKWQSNMRE